jgi:transposase
VAGLRRVDALLLQTKKKLAAAVRAPGTSLTEISGAGPVTAATVTGDDRDVSRFASQDRFAAGTGTAPTEVSCGNRVTRRLSTRANRHLNHAVHTAAITQIRSQHADGRACYDKKIAEGKTPEEALRALNRQISDAICNRLKADAARAAAPSAQGPRGHAGNDPAASAAGSHPERQLFGQATPGPDLTPRPQPRTQTKTTSHARRKVARTT